MSNQKQQAQAQQAQAAEAKRKADQAKYEADQAALAKSQAAKSQAAAPDPEQDAVAYLKFHNWRPLGQASAPNTRWLDPTKPNPITQPAGVETRVPVVAADQNGDMHPVMVKGKSGHSEQAQQVLWTPPATPVSREEAVFIQMNRDTLAAMRQTQAQAVA